jgi:hypothetical protein
MLARMGRMGLRVGKVALVALVLGFGAFAAVGGASAQTPTPFVALRDLTVEGREAPSDLRAALDSNTTGVMHGMDVCYAGRHAVHGDLAGALSLRLWVSSLQVIRVTRESTTVADDELFACVKQRLLEFRLPPDSPRAGVTVRFHVVFTPPPAGTVVSCNATTCSAEPCGALGGPCCPAGVCSGDNVCLEASCQVPPPPPPPAITFAITRTRGGPTDAALTAEIDAAAFQSCRDVPASSARTRIVGAVPFTLTVRSTGVVTATPSTGTLNNRPTITCLRAALTGMRLATRTRSTTARITITVPPIPPVPASPIVEAPR